MKTYFSDPIWRVAIGSLLAAAVLYVLAVARSRRESRGTTSEPKRLSDVLMALGTALIAGGAIALATFTLQQQVILNQDRETRLLMTANLSGCDPGPATASRGRWDTDDKRCTEHEATVDQRTFLRGRYLAARILDGARLGGLNLEKADFRDTSMRGAILTCSNVRHASFVHTDLAGADLRGADLRDTDLRGASLQGASLPLSRSTWKRAKVNAQTCWPPTRFSWARRLPVRPWEMDGRGPGKSYGHPCGTVEPDQAGTAAPVAAGEATGEPPDVQLSTASQQQLAAAIAQAQAAARLPTTTTSPEGDAPDSP